MSRSGNKYEIAREERRQQILTQAKKLFLQRGLTDVGMRDIASSCSISRQTLYKYFNGIDAIIFSIQEQIIHQFSLHNEKDLQSTLTHLFKYYQENTDDFLFISLFDVYVHTHQIDPDLLRSYHQTIHQCLPQIRLEEPMSGEINGVPRKKYVTVAIHAAWALITRMMILGRDFTEEYHITEEESFKILSRVLCEGSHSTAEEKFK